MGPGQYGGDVPEGLPGRVEAAPFPNIQGKIVESNGPSPWKLQMHGHAPTSRPVSLPSSTGVRGRHPVSPPSTGILPTFLKP